MRIDLIGKRHPLSPTDFQTPDNTSSSSQATTSTSQDVANSGAQGVAVGAGGSYVNEFSPDVATAVENAFSDVFNFAGNTVAALNTNTSAALQSVSAAAQSNTALAANAVSTTQLGTSSLFTNPATLLAGVVVVGLIMYFAFKKGR
jgi:hypothetical protein